MYGIMFTLFSCSDEFNTTNCESTFDPIYEKPEIECYNRYYVLKVEGLPKSNNEYSLSVDADWVELTTDIFPSDGLVIVKK